MKFIKEAHQIPYTGEALKVFNKIIKNTDNYKLNTLYYNKEIDGLWYINKLDYLYVVKFSKFLDGLIPSLGFSVEMLTKNNTLKEKGSLWALPIKEFKKSFTDMSVAEKFVSQCMKKIDGVDIHEAGDIIDKFYKEFTGDKK